MNLSCLLVGLLLAGDVAYYFALPWLLSSSSELHELDSAAKRFARVLESKRQFDARHPRLTASPQ